MNVVRSFRWPMMALLAVDVFFLLVGGVKSYDLESSRVIQWFAAMIVFFVMDCAAITVVGLWQGLIGRNSRQALTSALVRILVLPWIMFGLLNLVASVGLRSDIPEAMQLPVFIALSLMINGLFAWQAWEQLHQNLRLIAASRYGGARPAGWWAGLGRLWRRLWPGRRTA